MNEEDQAGRCGLASAFPISDVLRDLRSLRVCVFHPDDRDGKQLAQQLQRIGCHVQAFWPPLPSPPAGTDVVFIALYPDALNLVYEWRMDDYAPPSVAVLNYENPTIIEAMLRIDAKAVITSPIHSFGLLSAMVLAREIGRDRKKLRKRIVRLEEKLGSARKIAEAQDILCRQRGVRKDEAYRIMREQAMAKRMTIEDIASAIINANDIFSSG
ncbi:ANTAR domain-containing response regulator [Paraburkholderia silvatlantica]|uniref:ANTAR domain-containing response regulator n=1 Tax=Paraburkholderia silvatlantica TaxID=321895 RepID=UPI001061870D|nr:ANTAR domain-containing protein [Paraburkholderia silvatlantica]TDQ92285.1 AmiR/NasT family two-component response regulator [Paraburkholderia silvatlantica]